MDDTRTTLTHLNQVQLARRWRMSERTLERWRWLKKGPPYIKIGGRVVYRLEDIEAFEAAHLHQVIAPTEEMPKRSGGSHG